MTILVVEDEIRIRRGLAAILEQGFENSKILEAEDGRRCLDIMAEQTAHVVITDIRMPGMDGLSLMKAVGKLYPATAMLVLSGYDDFDFCKRAMQSGAVDYLLKPVDESELLAAVRRAAQKAGITEPETQRSEEGYSPAMRDIIEYIKRNYASDVSLGVLADEFHYAPGYVSQMFKRETGVNFLDYLNQVRVERAAQLLKLEGVRVEDAARRVGIGNPKYFSKLFRAVMGVTPSEYRRL